MIKNARIESGVTPSEVSGKVSTSVVDGVPLADGEKPPEKRLDSSSALWHLDNLPSRDKVN